MRVRGRAVATNAPPHGAFRGFGAPQSIFALERHMDKVAAAVGLAPDEFRRRNFITPGDTLAVGQTIARAGRHGRRCSIARWRCRTITRSASGSRATTRAAPIKKGIGFATFMHGAGFTGSGEVHLASVVAVEGTADGTVRVLTASTEIGQGTNTIFSQIAADALGIDCDDVDIVQPDTAVVPEQRADGRVAHLHGRRQAGRDRGARRQARAHRRRLPARACTPRAEFQRARASATSRRSGRCAATSQYQPPPGLRWDDEKYLGDAYGTYAGRSTSRRSSVDLATWETRVDDFVAVQEVGKVINPVLAAGQIEGGVAQGIGWALYEDVVWREGRMANAQMTNYIMPTSMDLPPIRVFFEEVPYPHGPAGAKGIGELPMDGPAPAIFNAVAHATGVDRDAAAADAGAPDGADGDARVADARSHRVTLPRQRPPDRARRASDGAAARRAAPRRGPHRHEGRLRRRGVRRLRACCSTASSSTAA